MGIIDKLKTVLTDVASTEAKSKKKPKLKAESIESEVKKPRTSKKKSAEDPEKVKATKIGEPWVKILNMELDPNDPGMGAFELDWNDKFVANLVRAGYQGKTDADIVDNWFQTVCRNIAVETWQQEQADPEARRNNNRRDLGNGRTEIS